MTENRVEFVSPFSLNNCKSRLEGRHEKATLLAFRWQTRTHVTVRQVDQETCTFTLKRVEKSAFSSMGSVVSVKGVLKKVDENRTLVTAEEKLSWFWFMAGSFLLGGVIGFMLFGSRFEGGTPNIRDVALVVSAGIAGTAGIMLLSWFYARNQTRVLMGILKDSLGYDLAIGKSPR